MTKVSHKCLREASVAGQINCDMTMELKLLCKSVFDDDEAVLEEPLTDNRSHAEFDDVEMHELERRSTDSRGSRL